LVSSALATTTRRINLAIDGQSQQVADAGEERPGRQRKHSGPTTKQHLPTARFQRSTRRLWQLPLRSPRNAFTCIEIHRKSVLEAGATEAGVAYPRDNFSVYPKDDMPPRKKVLQDSSICWQDDEGEFSGRMDLALYRNGGQLWYRRRPVRTPTAKGRSIAAGKS
jgi:hypothetical protein